MTRNGRTSLLALIALGAVACQTLDDSSTSSADAVTENGPEDTDNAPAEPTEYENRGFAALTFKGFDRDAVASERARLGLDDVFAGKGFHTGLPMASVRAAERLARDADLLARARGTRQERIDTSTPEGRFQVSGKLPSPPLRSAPAGTPIGQSFFTREGKELTNSNCFTCHAGVVRGQIVAGLGNHDIDQVSSLADVDNLLKIAPVLKAEARALGIIGTNIEYEELSDFLGNATGTVKPTFRFAEARGDNMGPYAVWKRLSRLEDPKRTGLSELDADKRTALDDLFDSASLVTVDPQPWWTRKYKSTSYAWAESSPAAAAHFAFNFTVPHADANKNHEDHVAVISDILEFAKQTTSPAFPETLDAAMVERGAALFHGRANLAAGAKLRCAGCHGSYEKTANFGRVGGWTVDYDGRDVVDVGTDPAYSTIVRGFESMATRGNGLKDYFTGRGKPEIAPQVLVPSKPGYVPQVLVGVWASAPYFHNGSVPTLYGVLKSDARPDVWTRSTDNPFAYSTVRVGLAHSSLKMTEAEYASRAEALASQHVGSAERVAFRAIYDTRRGGRSNKGHTFGDEMNDAERFAVIAFLESLSGDDMRPARRN